MGSSNRTIIYDCSTCGRDVGQDKLVVKRVQFLSLASKKLIRTRVLRWVCVDCIERDEMYQLPARSTTPGMRDTKLGQAG